MPAIKAIYRAKTANGYLHFSMNGKIMIEKEKQYATVFPTAHAFYAYTNMLAKVHLRTIPLFEIEREIIGITIRKEPKWLR